MKSRHRLIMILAVLLPALAVPAIAIAAADEDPPSPQLLIVNGRLATESYSFMVFVDGCSGSLIKADWVVTAKHCPIPESVRVGSTDRTTGGKVMSVVAGVDHPTIDVKLLKLASPVDFPPVAIPTSSGDIGTATRIIGWGQTCAPIYCGDLPTIAHESDTSIVDDYLCSGIDGPYEICTNDNNGTSGACYGDSGGPQVRRVNGVWGLIGVTSRAGNSSSTCATAPSIYGDLPSIRSWIEAEVGGLPAIDEAVPPGAIDPTPSASVEGNSPEPSASAGEPEPSESAGEPEPSASVGEPEPSVGEPAPSATAGEPEPSVSVGGPEPSASA